MTKRNRWQWFIGLAIGAIVLLTLILAPGGSIERRGSTYNRAPDGYAAWFAYMQQQQIPVERWQRSIADLVNATEPTTLLRVNYELQGGTLLSLDEGVEDWLKRGNTIIELGIYAPATRAPFTTKQESPQGEVKIETTRRVSSGGLLSDRFGSIVWRERVGRGQVIRATTPYLAANAYQNEPGNFAFLAELVRQNNGRILIDEFLHGYRDPDAESTVADPTTSDSLAGYLARTPLLLILIQAIVLFFVVLWSQNRRFGAPMSIASPAIDNSEAYIQALAGVLHKAGRSEFLIDTIGKAEQLHIQRALGLGTIPIDPENLRIAWQQQTDRSAADLDAVLNPPFANRRASDRDLLTWLQAIQSVRKQLDNS
ncbi:DUF4350 domain-containing protein [Microcoleus sp. FACHB-1515]|uniref:DUF4350 domain-containing protein n=1 Tax=Cyanophyceae TaxID=3028117 RepID=UPI00168902C8|nr:DUF4350 domain-containing protein [Microcoleus sp. FACHB-1515]MBD2089674.1 DUF4350 domain-containing protein [Microcoleus sp. FACHB-1515]